MGAIRPPWIDKEMFYRVPFNFCDRWCERCHLTKICKVYKEGERDKRRALKQGKDPNSWEFVAEVMHKNFARTIRLLRRGAKKWGLDWEEITRVDEKEYRSMWKKKSNFATMSFTNFAKNGQATLKRFWKSLQRYQLIYIY